MIGNRTPLETRRGRTGVTPPVLVVSQDARASTRVKQDIPNQVPRTAGSTSSRTSNYYPARDTRGVPRNDSYLNRLQTPINEQRMADWSMGLDYDQATLNSPTLNVTNKEMAHMMEQVARSNSRKTLSVVDKEIKALHYEIKSQMRSHRDIQETRMRALNNELTAQQEEMKMDVSHRMQGLEMGMSEMKTQVSSLVEAIHQSEIFKKKQPEQDSQVSDGIKEKPALDQAKRKQDTFSSITTETLTERNSQVSAPNPPTEAKMPQTAQVQGTSTPFRNQNTITTQQMAFHKNNMVTANQSLTSNEVSPVVTSSFEAPPSQQLNMIGSSHPVAAAQMM